MGSRKLLLSLALVLPSVAVGAAVTVNGGPGVSEFYAGSATARVTDWTVPSPGGSAATHVLHGGAASADALPTSSSDSSVTIATTGGGSFVISHDDTNLVGTYTAPNGTAGNEALTSDSVSVTFQDAATSPTNSQADTLNFTLNSAPTVANLAASGTPTEGAAFTFNVDIGDLEGGTDLFDVEYKCGTGSWTDIDPGGGAAGHTIAAAGTIALAGTCTPASDGNYNLQVRAKDLGDTTVVAQQDVVVSVANAAPTVSVNEPFTLVEGTDLTVTGACSDADITDINSGTPITVTASWSGGSEANTVACGNISGNAGTYTTTFGASELPAPGVAVTVSATINDGTDTDTDTASVANMGNVAPTLSISNPTVSANEGSAAALSATIVDPLTNEVHAVTWAWNPGGGQQTSNATSAAATKSASTSITFTDEGAYTVDLDVADPTQVLAGNTTNAEYTVNVSNVAPTIFFASDCSSGSGSASPSAVSPNEATAFNLTACASDPGADTLSAAWSWTDSAGDPQTANSSFTGGETTLPFTFADDGAYTVNLVVSDGDGGSDSVDFAVTVNNVAPTLNTLSVVEDGEAVEVFGGNEGGAFAFSAIAADIAGSADPLTWSWSFGDGGTSTDPSPVYTYANSGSFLVSVTVSDGDGGTATALTRNMTIANVAPVISSISVPAVSEGEEAVLVPGITDPGADTITYAWSYTDNDGIPQTSTSETFSYTWDDNGAKAVSLVVNDGEASSAASPVVVNVASAAPEIQGIALDVAAAVGSSSTLTVTATDPGAADLDELTFDWVVEYEDPTSPGTMIPVTSLADQLGTEGSGVSTDSLLVNWTQLAEYTISVTVEDDDTLTDTYELVIDVASSPPVINDVTVNGFSNPPSGIEEADAVTFSVNVTNPGGGALSYEWDFGDGDSGFFGSSPTHTYTNDGTYPVTVTVTGTGGSTTSTAKNVVIENAVPTINSLSPAEQGGSYDTTVSEGNDVQFIINASDAGDDTLTYSWDFGDGTTTSGTETVVLHTYADNPGGTNIRTATVTVSDGTDSVSQSREILVNNVAPSVPAPTYTAAVEGSPFTVSVAASDPGDQADLTYTWTYDGVSSNTGTTPSKEYTIASDGVYTISVDVNDGDATSSSSVQVNVVNAAPTISGSSMPDTSEGVSTAYSLSVSDPGNDSVSVQWDMGDGTIVAGASVSHTYVEDGIYTVTATATDSGGLSVAETNSVTVTNTAPTVTNFTVVDEGGSAAIEEGEIVNLSVAATDPGVDDTFTFAWDVDGDAYTGSQVQLVFPDNGSIPIAVTVTDDDGDSSVYNTSVSVSNVAPQVTLDDFLAAEGAQANTMALVVEPGDDTLTYLWTVEYDDSGTIRTTTVNTEALEYTWDKSGTFDVTVRVEDDDGGVGTASAVATVAVVPPVSTIDVTPPNVLEGSVVGFAGTAQDTGGNDVRQVWNFGDGSGDQDYVAGTGTVYHSWDSDGTYTVTLTAFDNRNNPSTPATFIVDVLNDEPVLSASTIPDADEGIATAFVIEAYDQGNDAMTVDWTVDGQPVAAVDQNIVVPWSQTVDGITYTSDQDGVRSTLTYTWPDDDTFTLGATITDADGGETVLEWDRSVLNVAPSPATTPTIPTLVDEGQTLSFFTEVYEPGTDTVDVEWDFGDGTVLSEQGVLTSSPTHDYVDDGTYIVRLTMTDEDGGESVLQQTVVIENLPPAPAGALAVPTINEGEEVFLSWPATDIAADPITWTWTFGDSSGAVESSTDSVTHTWTGGGDVTIQVTATDDEGASSSDSVVANVINLDPVIVDISAPDGDEGEELTFSASATDPGGDPLSYVWTLGKGSVGERVVTGATVTHTFVDDGEETVELTVTDGDGGSATSTQTVTISNVAPTFSTLEWPNTNPTETESVSFVGAGTDQGADSVTVSWDFGDGTTLGGVTNPSHQWDNDGTFVVTVTLDDGEGGVTTETETFIVSNILPTIESFGGDAEGDEGDTYSFAATASDISPIDEAALLFTWDFGDGSTPVVGTDVSHVFVDNGEYNVVLTVDDGTDTVVESMTVTATNVAPEWATVYHDNNGTYEECVGSVNECLILIGTENESYKLCVEYTDLGVADDITVALTRDSEATNPGTLTLGASCTDLGGAGLARAFELDWVPAFEDFAAGSTSFSFEAFDGDDYTEILSWDVFVEFEDLDADGLPDSWEDDPNTPQIEDIDPAGDEDGDGVDNELEWDLGWEPRVNDLPVPPVLIETGARGSDVEPQLMTFEWERVTDRNELLLDYGLQVFGIDEDLTQPVPLALADIDRIDIDDALDLNIIDTFTRTLLESEIVLPFEENAYYKWRMRSLWDLNDSVGSSGIGEWGETVEFVFDSQPERPSYPYASSPRFADGGTVTDIMPTFTWTESSDPELLDVTYNIYICHVGEFCVGPDASDTPALFVEDVEVTEILSGTVSAVVDLSSLEEDENYSWRVTAVDPGGLESIPVYSSDVVDANGDPSELDDFGVAVYQDGTNVRNPDSDGLFAPFDLALDDGGFYFSLINGAPGDVELQGPTDGSETDDLSFAIYFNTVTDPEGDLVTYQAQIDTDVSFATADLVDIVVCGDGEIVVDAQTTLSEKEFIEAQGGRCDYPINTLSTSAVLDLRGGVDSSIPAITWDEETTVYVRMRSVDAKGAAQASWSGPNALFLRGNNDAPDTPELVAPADYENIYGQQVTFEASEALDVEGDAVEYRFVISRRAGDNAVLFSNTVYISDDDVGSVNPVWIWDVPEAEGDDAANGEFYRRPLFWRVQAIDDRGQASEYSEWRHFRVYPEIEPRPREEFITCNSAPGSFGAYMLLPLALFARRRRA